MVLTQFLSPNGFLYHSLLPFLSCTQLHPVIQSLTPGRLTLHSARFRTRKYFDASEKLILKFKSATLLDNHLSSIFRKHLILQYSWLHPPKNGYAVYILHALPVKRSSYENQPKRGKKLGKNTILSSISPHSVPSTEYNEPPHPASSKSFHKTILRHCLSANIQENYYEVGYYLRENNARAQRKIRSSIKLLGKCNSRKEISSALKLHAP